MERNLLEDFYNQVPSRWVPGTGGYGTKVGSEYSAKWCESYTWVTAFQPSLVSARYLYRYHLPSFTNILNQNAQRSQAREWINAHYAAVLIFNNEWTVDTISYSRYAVNSSFLRMKGNAILFFAYKMHNQFNNGTSTRKIKVPFRKTKFVIFKENWLGH